MARKAQKTPVDVAHLLNQVSLEILRYARDRLSAENQASRQDNFDFWKKGATERFGISPTVLYELYDRPINDTVKAYFGVSVVNTDSLVSCLSPKTAAWVKMVSDTIARLEQQSK